MQKPQLVAADTNVLMRLAAGHDATVDAWHLIQRRLHPIQLLVPPTVLLELGYKASHDADPSVRELALRSMLELRPRWRFKPEEFNAVQEVIAEHALRRLRDAALLPAEERNDASILVEAAVLNCVLLVSRDSHLLDLDHERLAFVFGQCDLPTPVVSSPEILLKKFYH
jgi:predicted nucleic acid-binding protein